MYVYIYAYIYIYIYMTIQPLSSYLVNAIFSLIYSKWYSLSMNKMNKEEERNRTGEKERGRKREKGMKETLVRRNGYNVISGN